MSGQYGEFLHYPAGGGLYEQDWKFMAIFVIIQGTVKQHLREEIERKKYGA